jgi:hypothetical protein
LNEKADGYRGVWYQCCTPSQPQPAPYVYKYSGGLGTYCAKHRPFAIYRDEVQKTFFCYGGAAEDSPTRLLHMVSYYDHRRGVVPRPTILLDKQTSDAHDNPTLCIDDEGRLWVFSSAHGTARPSFIHRSVRPYDIDQFEAVPAAKLLDGREVPITNFSYMSPWFTPGRGFIAFFSYYGRPAARFCMTSQDGFHWSEWIRIPAIQQGYYQISVATAEKAACAFNRGSGNNIGDRTDLYYLETFDFGRTWRAADGTQLDAPPSSIANPALVRLFHTERCNVYLKDIDFDQQARPVILFLTTKGKDCGPSGDPRIWRTARWTGDRWEVRAAMRSDNNYDCGSLYLEAGAWRIIAPTQTGPQPYNTGGEMAMWLSRDQGQSWEMVKQLTRGSQYNHTYARRPLHAHPDFYALWADGHARRPSESSLYCCDKAGNVRVLPRRMTADSQQPRPLEPPTN